MRNTKGQFVKGYGFWKGKKRPGLKTSTTFEKGHKTWNKGLKLPEQTGERNATWKGDNVGYSGIHAWVVRSNGKANHCVNCQLDKAPIGWKKYFQWANISGKYKRDLNDWKQLCVMCHRVFDGFNMLTKEQAVTLRTRYLNGERQRALAKEFGISQSAVSCIIRGKSASGNRNYYA